MTLNEVNNQVDDRPGAPCFTGQVPFCGLFPSTEGIFHVYSRYDACRSYNIEQKNMLA
jgi:hypothetical protein